MVSKHTEKYPVQKYRMPYNPDFHENHNKDWTVDELIYMCSMWDVTKKADIALALGRTHASVLTQADKLRKSGDFEYYKKLADSQ
ncbi:DNA-entry nuclease [Gracilibacillus saliphilus]|uniref:DNA-entry nuclease n=1 Tax=Gracilibacillus saliphilus TaxID=543890 RepID=UPI00192E07EE|nr:DNA-entry nuclease [Gracilibacillus saliphilus]